MNLRRQLGGWLRSSHSLKECVIAHQSSGFAPIMVGTQVCHRSQGCGPMYAWVCGVGEHCLSGEAGPEGFPWSAGKRECRNEYTRNGVRTPVAESPRVPEPCRSAQGQSAPKVRPKGVADGKRVKIPVPFVSRSSLRRDAEVTGPSDGGIRCKEVGVSGEANPPGEAEIRCRRGLRTPPRDRNQTAEKSFAGEASGRPYRKPTQVGEARSLRRSSDSWSRNSAKCPRNFGRRGARGR